MSAIVLIGPAAALPFLQPQLPPDSEVQTFTEADVRDAVEFIAAARPEIIAIDDGFAASARGEALVDRILEDPELAVCEIRILSRNAKTTHPQPPRRHADVDTAPPARPLDPRGTRRAPRVRLIDGVAITVDGNPAELVDLSVGGAQVVSRIVLRPSQRVRVTLPEGTQALRCAGAVVWASFEMPPGLPPRYRAGLKLSGVEDDALREFADRHRAQARAESSR